VSGPLKLREDAVRRMRHGQERRVVALGWALHVPERVAPLLLDQLDDDQLERLRQALLKAFVAAL
jgi:hypothetical protein